eukprot:110049_1
MNSFFAIILSLSVYICHSCSSNKDCTYLGYCDTSTNKCICNPGFIGTNCTDFNISSTIDWSTDGYHDYSTSTWDGTPIYSSKDNKWHLFISILTNTCPLGAWLTNSIIGHVTAINASGPYTYSDIALNVYNDTQNINNHWDGLSVYNPSIIQASNGTYLLYYTGTTAPNAKHKNCNSDKQLRNVKGSTEEYNQRVGLAYSNNLYGPWNRLSKPILLPRGYNNSLWDSNFTTNPSPFLLQNGSIALAYKGRSNSNLGNMYTGIAMLVNGSEWYLNNENNYIRAIQPLNLPTNCEDAYLWQQRSVYDTKAVNLSYHLALHCGCNGMHAYSLDLKQWNHSQQQPWCNITLTNGSIVTLKSRQRPAIALDESGNVHYLFNAVQASEGRTFNFVQNLR